MTVEAHSFPVGYFYIVSKMNGFALDFDPSQEAAPGTKIVTALKKEGKPERDTQLWMHQSGFLTNKYSGLVLDIGKSKTFMAIFTGEEDLYLDNMKAPENANDQRFGFDSSQGQIYTLHDPNQVLDIRKKSQEQGTTICMNEHAQVGGIHQFWDLVVADPPKVVDPSEEAQDDSVKARLSAWFGNWLGWHTEKKREVLDQAELHKVHEKVYKDNKSQISSEVFAGAVAVQALKKYEEKGSEDHTDGKQIVTSIATEEMLKIFSERSIDGGDDEDTEEKKAKKQNSIQKMVESAATNLFEATYLKL